MGLRLGDSVAPSDIVGLACANIDFLGLHSNGTVSDLGPLSVFGGDSLTNAVAIAAGSNQVVALEGWRLGGGMGEATMAPQMFPQD